MPSFRKAFQKITVAIAICSAPYSLVRAQTQAMEAPAPASPHERDHVQEREEWFRSGRKARGETSADLLQRAYTQKSRMRAAREQAQKDAAAAQREGGRTRGETSVTPNFSNLLWQSLGPTPMIFDPAGTYSYGAVTGRVSAIAVDQNDSTGNTVYVGGASGGVWKSVNAAATDPNAVSWRPLIDDQPSLAVGAIALQPGTNLVLVGTGETNSSPDSYYGMGILRSMDGGNSWTLISDANNHARSFRGLGFSKIAFSSVSPNIVVAAAASTNGATPGGNGAETQGADGRGLYFSTDSGQTWFYGDIRDPDGTIQAGSVGDLVYNQKHGKFYAAVRWHGYYSSTDGATWTRLVNQPGGITNLTGDAAPCPGNPISRSCPEYRASLSVREDTGQVYTIFVDSAGNTSTGGGVFVLQSDGGTWTQLAETGIDGCLDSDGCGTKQGTYNLYIKAVPNGSNTDLYVGAVNIFKCSSSLADPFCNASSAWKNLTHVYGCSPFGAPAHVHPDQHAIDFAKNSLPTRIYFGNDGGLYRALDSAGLSSGACTTANAFDNLNNGIGSFSEFVSFSQHPTNPGILLGGLQDNGSPALDSNNAGAQGTTWQGLNQSDGGYNAIDPNAPSTFFTSFYQISVQTCASGTSCGIGVGWSPVISSNTVAGDGSAFYPPYILDPSLTTKILFGTCRLWRGNASPGSTYLPISNNFAVGAASQCADNTSTGDTKIRSIAAGGSASPNGSQVIYVGMGSAAPINGHVFVTTSADGGPASWVDRTGNINPSGYDISDIAISPSDPSGNTAYLTVMGFGTSHVFKTTDAGATWIDKNADLPDSPANSIALDPTNTNVLYVGTDVGVFVSIDDGVSWADFGAGMPNVPVVKMKTFASGGVKKLRAATYGRGLWQIDLASPDVNFSGSTLSFATVVGRTSVGQQTTLTNNSAGPITIGSISASGEFRASSDCPPVLPTGVSCRVAIFFSPLSAGIRSGSLLLTSNASGGLRTLPLSGNGVDFALTLVRPARPTRSAANTAISRVSAAAPNAIVDVVVSSTGAAALDGLPSAQTQVELQCVGAPSGMQCAVEPSSVDLARETNAVRVIVSMALQQRLPMRLQPKPAKGTYYLQLKAISGKIVRIINLPIAVSAR
ncbi:MAG: hypothetical protein JWN45_2709 [Acidobacteriaceae bacterium]|nr:hypothetical protein [Acidobacteriaceae bacterium]